MSRPLHLALALALLCAALLSGPARAQDARELARDLDASVGWVQVFDRQGRPIGNGSGYAVGETSGGDPLFMTNQHVIDGAFAVAVIFAVDSQPEIFHADVVNASAEYDMAVLRLTPEEEDASDFAPRILPLADHPIERGEQVYALGYPSAGNLPLRDAAASQRFVAVLTGGIVSRRSDSSWTPAGGNVEILQHDAAINPGNSGGPLVTRCGTVAGLNTQGMVGTANSTGFASSSRTMKAFLSNSGIEPRLARPCGDGPGWQVWTGGGLLLAAALGTVVWARGGTGGMAQIPFVAAKPAATLLALDIAGRRAEVTADALERGILIGRAPDAGLVVDDDNLSRQHALLQLRDRKLYISDLGSTNGTKVGGTQIARDAPVQINTRSRVELGGLRLRLARRA